MKRMIYVAGLFAPVAAYVIGLACAQQTVATAPAPAATKVGLVNIGYVSSKWQKMHVFKSDSGAALKPYRDEEEKLKKLIEDWRNYRSDWDSELTKEVKEQDGRTIAESNRRLCDLSFEFRKAKKKTEDQLVRLYKELGDEVKRVTESQSFHLILAFNEPLDGDLYSQDNVIRKVQAMDQGAVIPMYYAGWMDISPTVLANLNGKSINGSEPTAAPPPTVTKVGVLDLGYIFGSWKKVRGSSRGTDGLDPRLKPYRDEEEKLRKLVIDWQNALDGGKLTPEQIEQGKRTIKDCQRRIEDLDIEFRKAYSKNHQSRLAQLYKEISDATKRLAETQGYHLILGYGEPMDGDFFSFANVTRKMQAMDQGAAIQTFCAAWPDISRQVLENLRRDNAPTTEPKEARTK